MQSRDRRIRPLSGGPRGVEANRDGAWKLNETRHSHDTWTRGHEGTRKETRRNVCRSIKVIRDIEGLDRGTISPMATFHDGQCRSPRLDSRPLRVLPPANLRSIRTDSPPLDVVAPDPRSIDRHIADQSSSRQRACDRRFNRFEVRFVIFPNDHANKSTFAFTRANTLKKN